jgi:ABC-2 type transport system permease protein
MNPMKMTMVVARKEMKDILKNKALLFGSVWVGASFGTIFSSQAYSLDNSIFSMALLGGVLVGYMFSGQVFLREKRAGTIETLLCTPLSLKAIWLGKVVGTTIPAYLISLLTVALVTVVTNIRLHSSLFPSAVMLIHVFVVVPVFIASAISLMGLCHLLFGMRENKIIGYLVMLGILPFIFPNFIGGLIVGNTSLIVSYAEVVVALIASVLLFALTIYSSRYLSKEKIVTTIS